MYEHYGDKILVLKQSSNDSEHSTLGLFVLFGFSNFFSITAMQSRTMFVLGSIFASHVEGFIQLSLDT